MLRKSVRKAIMNRNLEGLETALKSVNINDFDDYGNAALHLAYQYGTVEMIKYLKEKGADTHLENDDGEIPLFKLVRRKDIDIVDELIKSGENLKQMNKHKESIVLYAVPFGTDEMLKKLIEIGLDPNDTEGSHLWTPLHAAASLRKNSKIKILLDAKAIYNLKDDEGKIPLHHCAAYNPSREATEILLAKDTSQVNACDSEGNTPFSLALEFGSLEVVKVMSPYAAITENSLHNIIDGLTNLICWREGMQDFEVSVNKAIKESAEKVKIVLEKGADIGIKNSDNRTPLEKLKLYIEQSEKLDIQEIEKLLS